MSDIRISIEQLDEPQKSLGKALIEFYETMKSLEKDIEHGAGKKAVKIIMTMGDIEKIFEPVSPSPDNTARTAEEWLKENHDDVWAELCSYRLKNVVCYLMDKYSQFKSQPQDSKEVEEKSISNYRIKERAKQWCSNENDMQKYIEGAKWMRDKLTNKQR